MLTLLGLLGLLVAPTRLLTAELVLLTALRSGGALALLGRVAVLAALATGLSPTLLALLPLLPGLWLLTAELPLLAGSRPLRLLTLVSLLATRLAGWTGLSRMTRLATLTRSTALLLRGALLGLPGLLATPGPLLPALLLTRSPLTLHLVTAGRLCLLATSGLALLLRGETSLALESLLTLLALPSLVSGLRLLTAELALLALRRLLAGLTRLSTRLTVLLGLAALLALVPTLLAGIARSLLASRCVLLVSTALLAALVLPAWWLPALLAPLSAVLFASALGVAVLPAHGVRLGRTYTEQRINGVHRSRERGLKAPVRPPPYAS